MHATCEVSDRPRTTSRNRWNRDLYDICVIIRPRDADLLADLQAAQVQLALPDLAATARVLIGLASIDVLPWSPEQAGTHTGGYSRGFIEQHKAHMREQPARRVRPSRQSSHRNQIRAVLDTMLYAPVAIRRSLRRHKSKSDAARELLWHGLELLDADGERVEAFLAAHNAALAGEGTS